MPLKDTIERIRNQPEPPNEESAKAQLILPILHLADPAGTRVEER